MGLREHVICDSDLHVMEPPDLWERYIDPAYAHAAPRGLSEIQRDMRVRVKNHTMLRMGTTRPQRVEGRKTGWQPHHDNVYAASEARGWDPQSQVDAMASGTELIIPSHEVAAKTARLYQPGVRRTFGDMEWPAMRRVLDRDDPSYAE